MSEETQNTDLEIWRGPDEGNGDYYADSIHVTKTGGIGINCGGHVKVRPLHVWFAFDDEITRLREENEKLREALKPFQGNDICEAVAAQNYPDVTPMDVRVTLGDLRKARLALEALELGCQADASVTGEPVSASPLQSGSSADAVKTDFSFIILNILRGYGWSVAVHNDYRLDGKFHTFWLLTHSSGRWIKGEGESDEIALTQALSQLEERSDEVSAAGGEGGLTPEEHYEHVWQRKDSSDV